MPVSTLAGLAIKFKPKGLATLSIILDGIEIILKVVEANALDKSLVPDIVPFNIPSLNGFLIKFFTPFSRIVASFRAFNLPVAFRIKTPLFPNESTISLDSLFIKSS